MSDLRLTNTGVISEGTYFAIHGISLELKDETRKRPNTTHVRRALIHGAEDQLIMNFDNDYHGVEINGKNKGVSLNGKVEINGPDLSLTEESRKSRSNRKPYRRAMVHGNGDLLVLNFDDDYLGVEINGSRSEGVKLNGDIFVNDKNIEEMIEGLQKTIDFLLEERKRTYEAINLLNDKVGLPRFIENPIHIDLGPRVVIPPVRRP